MSNILYSEFGQAYEPLPDKTSDFDKYFRGLRDFKSGDDIREFLEKTLPAINEFKGNQKGVTQKQQELINNKFPELTPEVLLSLGVENLDAQRDVKLTGEFRKEGAYDAGDKFCVVKDTQGVLWLLKKGVKVIKYDNDKYKWAKDNKQTQFNELRYSQAEVLASRIANKIDYPIAEAKLVQFENEVWIALKRLEGVVETTEDEASNRAVTNPNAQRVRPLFNVLVNAEGDASWQGLIDSTNKYYAHDISVKFSERDPNFKDEEGLIRDLVSSLSSDDPDDDTVYQLGHLDIASQEGKQMAKDFLVTLSKLDESAARKIFFDLIGPQKQKSFFINQLMRRKKVLPMVVDKLSKNYLK